ncbi:hypothetical protein DFH07DRAFT_565065 [Mycena maculata]|uniref:Uncharacterized protein n=1 Tax=Mycena maculata TaxID=230809 RepID=A0AAD7N759_9AGAR|nr:hypothetical protein DFH07DRAFT_565065 [Mycena maculata]
MFANNNASRSFTSLTSDEIRWLNASSAFGEDGDSVRSVPSVDLVKSQSVAIPKISRPRYSDTRRRSILLDDFLGNNTLSRSADSPRSRFGFRAPSSPTNSPPPSPDESLPVTPPRVAAYASAHLNQSLTPVQEMPRLPQRPTEWLYRRPKSPSSLSRSPSSLSSSPSSISRSPSSPASSRSATPTPSKIRPPTGYRPHTPTPPVAEMNQSPFWSTVVPPQRSPSVRTGSSSHGSRTPSRSSPNLLDFRGSSKSKTIGGRPKPLPIQRERSGSVSSSISTSSTGSLPRTPPSPSIYSQHSFTYPHPDTRSTTPTKSILTLTPKRSPSISTKHSSASKSVKFDEVPAICYSGTGDRELRIGDGRVRGEEWNSHVLNGAVDCMGFDMEDMDLLQGRGTPTPAGKTPGGSLRRFLTLGSRNKIKTRPEISGPYALAPSSPGLPPQPSESLSSLSSPFKSKSSSSSFIQGDVGVIPSSPNGGTDPAFSPKYKPKKPSSLIGPGDLGVLPDHGRFLQPHKFYSHPARYKAPKAASVTNSGSLGLLASEPVLHTLPSMESFRSVRSAKGTRSCGRIRDWLGRIGIGVVV